MENVELLKEWQDRIAEYRASGLTKVAWCANAGYPVKRLQYWIARANKLARASEMRGWTRVEVADSTPASSSGISLRVGIARIEVEPGFDKAVLGEVMRVAASIC